MLNLNQLKKLYINSPHWVQSIYAAIPFNIRNGSEYRQWRTFLKKNLNVDEYEIVKLKETILYAYEHTKYYKNLFDDNHIDPYMINTRKDLQSVPLLTKELVRENFHDLQATAYSKSKKYFITTGGTTGYPATFYQSQNVWKKELAFVADFFEGHGYDPSLLKASFKVKDFKDADHGIFWKKDYINNTIHFSPLHLNRSTVSKYVQKLNELKPLFFHTYPSNLLFLIDNMLEQNLSLDYQVHTVFLVSEGYTKNDIQKIKQFFNCEVTSFYGHSEHILFVKSITPEVDIYQIEKRYGFFELVDDDKHQIIENNISGTIVGTTFDNYAMPLIRYETDDLTQYLDYETGRVSMIDSLRNQVYLDGENGIKISITSFNLSPFADKIHIWQLYQEHPGKIDVLIVPKKGFTQEDKDKILSSIRTSIGDVLECDLKLRDHPLLTPRGKMTKMNKKPIGLVNEG